MIQLNNENLTYKGKTALSDITLSLPSGQKLALVGHSGSGKSSLLKLLYNRREKQKKSTAFIPQEYALVQNLSVFHNVYMGQIHHHATWYNLLNLVKPLEKPITDVTKILESLQLNNELFEPVAQLSGGQQQRTAIARAIMHSGNRPGNILLADEPVSSLDETQSKLIMQLLCQQFETAVFSLHDIDLALEFCDRIIGLEQGRITIDAPADNLNRTELLKLYGE
ncbi:Phosphonate ABC transporter ATP-binding protein (TC 3.A.1.9.1) [hydrothermal vent metagenome]|uniref:Phosphonate ABC transporter ATP-binding protein (TC 3.A.1.9.1) n=1 Tax=hydrothermal vent metagenome TaxID=652676 RepID=A0A3B0X5K9_9ZZZZ